MPTVPWPTVVLASVALVAITVLGIFHVDAQSITNVLLLVGLGVGGGVVAGQLQGIRSNVNGNVTRLTQMIESAMEKLSRAQPIDPQDKQDGGG